MFKILMFIGFALFFFGMVVDVVVPCFTNREFFWVFGSIFKRKTKSEVPKVERSQLQREYDEAEETYKTAKKKFEDLGTSAGIHAKAAEEYMHQTKEVANKTKEALDKLK